MLNSCPKLILIVSLLSVPIQAFAKAGDPNPMEIVISDGPLAGSYQAAPSETICLHVKGKQYSATYKDFNAHDPKKLSEAGINVQNPDDPGAKNGEVRITFGDPDKSPVNYDVNIVADNLGPLTVMKSSDKVLLAFKGKTKDGIGVTVTARCANVEEF